MFTFLKNPVDERYWKEYFLPPAGSCDSQWYPVGLEVGDQLCGPGLGLAGGEQGGQMAVQLCHQLTVV